MCAAGPLANWLSPTLSRRVDAQQRQDVGGVVVHRQLGARLGAARGLHAAGQDLLLNAHHAVTEGVVRHQVTEVGAERPVDALEVLDRVLLDGKSAHAGQALAEHQILVEPRQIVVEIGVPSVLGRDVIAVLFRGLGQDRFQRSHIAGRQVEGEVFLAGEVGAGPRHWVDDGFGVDRRSASGPPVVVASLSAIDVIRHAVSRSGSRAHGALARGLSPPRSSSRRQCPPR